MRRKHYFFGEDEIKLRQLIKEKTGYCLSNRGTLSQAFRRRSYCAEYGGKSNEMFEFIGDQVLSYYVVKFVTKRCCAKNIESDYSFRIREDSFTSLKQDILSNRVMSEIIDEWGVAEYLIVGKSDEQNHVDQQTKVKADLLESIIGAIAFESNWDSTVLEEVVAKALNLEDRLQNIIDNDYNSALINMENAVTHLKELAEKEQCSMPKYTIRGPEAYGYTSNGNPIWSCSCDVINDETGLCRVVFASSKKDAKRAAAYLVLCEHYHIQNQYGDNAFYPVWKYENGKLVPYKDAFAAKKINE